MLMGNAGPAQISMKHRFRGPMYAVSSACASSNDAMAIAFDLIRHGYATAIMNDWRLRGDGHRHRDGRLRLDEGDVDAQRRARPGQPTLHRERDGFVMGEGGAILIFEELEFAPAARRAHLC